MELEVGKLYLSRGGKKVKITYCDMGFSWPFEGTEGKTYLKSGHWKSEFHDTMEDLIKELTPEEYPEYFI